VPEQALPVQQSLTLSSLRQLAPEIRFADLANVVGEFTTIALAERG
jgi:hypothetical protein